MKKLLLLAAALVACCSPPAAAKRFRHRARRRRRVPPRRLPIRRAFAADHRAGRHGHAGIRRRMPTDPAMLRWSASSPCRRTCSCPPDAGRPARTTSPSCPRRPPAQNRARSKCSKCCGWAARIARDLEPFIESWKKQKPDYVKFVQEARDVGAGASRAWRAALHARSPGPGRPGPQGLRRDPPAQQHAGRARQRCRDASPCSSPSRRPTASTKPTSSANTTALR